MHHGGAGSRYPAVALDNRYEMHLERNLFFRSPLSGANNSLKTQPAPPGLTARFKGKHALPRGVARKTGSYQTAPCPWRSSQLKPNPPDLGNSHASLSQIHTSALVLKSRDVLREKSNWYRLPWQCAWMILSPLSAATAFRPIIREHWGVFCYGCNRWEKQKTSVSQKPAVCTQSRRVSCSHVHTDTDPARGSCWSPGALQGSPAAPSPGQELSLRAEGVLLRSRRADGSGSILLLC